MRLDKISFGRVLTLMAIMTLGLLAFSGCSNSKTISDSDVITTDQIRVLLETARKESASSSRALSSLDFSKALSYVPSINRSLETAKYRASEIEDPYMREWITTLVEFRLDAVRLFAGYIRAFQSGHYAKASRLASQMNGVTVRMRAHIQSLDSSYLGDASKENVLRNFDDYYSNR
jgi:hypothetical protein